MRKKFTIVVLLLIVFLGLLIRLIVLENIPHGFFADEASIGYNAYTIAHTGKDEYGIPFPLFFRAFGEYKSPVQIYSTAAVVSVFGLSEWSVRLVSVVYGVLGIAAMYFAATKLFWKHPHRDSIGLTAAFFLAISPWHIHLSRIAFEQMPFLFFFLGGLATYLTALHEEKPLYFFISCISFLLSFYSYSVARLFLPLFIPMLILLFYPLQAVRKKQLYLFFFVFLGVLPYLFTLFHGEGLARWSQVSIFSHPPERTNIAQQITNNYLKHFSPEFLFLKGDSGMEGQFVTRHSLKDFGELYLFQLPLLLLGGIVLIVKKHYRLFYFFVGWLLLYPLGSIFTTDATPQATRSVIGVLPLQILSAYGLMQIFFFLKKRNSILFFSTSFAVITVCIIAFYTFLIAYFVHYPLYSSDFWGWQYGPREIMHYFLANKNDYDDLYMSGEFNGSNIFLKFYDPTNRCQTKCKIGDPWRDKDIYKPNRKQLFSLSADYLEKSPYRDRFQTNHIVLYPNKTVAFEIGEIVQ